MGRGKLIVHRDASYREGYTRKGGTRVAGADIPATTYKVEDRGEPGRTPESEQFYEPKVHDTGWHKNMPLAKRRLLQLQAHHGDLNATYHAMDGLAKVTTDIETRREAQKDAEYFRELIHRRNKMLRVTEGNMAHESNSPRGHHESGDHAHHRRHERRVPRVIHLDGKETLFRRHRRI